VPHYVQPNFSNIAGKFALTQTPSLPASTLLGRGSSGPGDWQAITLGSGLTITGQVLNVAAGINTMPVGKTLYVDSVNGNNTTAIPGEFTKPYANITNANTAATAGDVIYVNGGTFIENSGFTIKDGVAIYGAGSGITTITSTLNDGTHAVVRPGLNSVMSDIAIVASGPLSAPIGVQSGDAGVTGAVFSSIKATGINQAVKMDKTGGGSSITITGSRLLSGATGVLNNVADTVNLLETEVSVDASPTSNLAIGVWSSGTNSNIVMRSGTIRAAGSTAGNTAIFCGSGAFVEAHTVVLDRGTGGTSWDLQKFGGASGALKIENVTRNDGAALTNNGAPVQLSRYALRDNNLSDFPNLGTGTRGDIITRISGGWTRFPKGLEGQVLMAGSTDVEWGDPPTSSFDPSVDNLFSVPQSITLSNAATNTIDTILSLSHNTSGTPASGFGGALRFQLESGGNPSQEAGQIGAAWSTATFASRSSYVSLQAVNNAAAMAPVARFWGSGAAWVGTSPPSPITQDGVVAAKTGYYVGGTAPT